MKIKIDLSKFFKRKVEEVKMKVEEVKIKVEEEKTKWNCKRDGHNYEIIQRINYVEEVFVENPKPTGSGEFFLQCSKCEKRRIMKGTLGMFTDLWESGEITTKVYKKLNNEVAEFLKEKQNIYREFLENKNKPKAKKKLITKKRKEKK